MHQLYLKPEFIITFCIFAASVTVVIWMSILERRPRDSLAPSLLPTTPLMLVAGAVGIFAVVHLLNLYGIHTGR